MCEREPLASVHPIPRPSPPIDVQGDRNSPRPTLFNNQFPFLYSVSRKHHGGEAEVNSSEGLVGKS